MVKSNHAGIPWLRRIRDAARPEIHSGLSMAGRRFPLLPRLPMSTRGSGAPPMRSMGAARTRMTPMRPQSPQPAFPERFSLPAWNGHRRAISRESRRKSLHTERVAQAVCCSAAASSSEPLPFVPVRNPSRRPIPPAKSIISDRERLTTLLTSAAFAHNPAHRRLCAPGRSFRMSLKAYTGTQLIAG